ncbi:hypothetical protein BU24DRAFT_462974 [Aaosphaeria arxii CBS 175.79]|uniref:Uncharacterized protein n=1 Tax=Aaosphaeria arxii CBS 175.79 TaxID=1450172 RepID=A0A6A5XMI9_9PLEO|nr:uncharacterized protein BU24DRAFT_462974 [Aaosphaeria arxii CBS 175.79]KAF2014163.1 hypothetical protein BU24DRAFT_462974 [Aaosphaeria arxii CBS 175.79]
MANAGQTPFPLLSLPPELRLIVYENIPRERKYIKLRSSFRDFRYPHYIILPIGTVSTSLLASSGIIHGEASSIVDSAVNDWLLEVRPRITCSFEAIVSGHFYDLLELLCEQTSRFMRDARRRFLEQILDTKRNVAQRVHYLNIIAHQLAHGEATFDLAVVLPSGMTTSQYYDYQEHLGPLGELLRRFPGIKMRIVSHLQWNRRLWKLEHAQDQRAEWITSLMEAWYPSQIESRLEAGGDGDQLAELIALPGFNNLSPDSISTYINLMELIQNQALG